MIPQQRVSLKALQKLIDEGDANLALELIASEQLDVEIIHGRVVERGTTEAWLARFITTNVKMLELKDDIRKLAKVQDEVLVVGETGTGKELIARALHGNRKQFVALNCAGLPEGLVESELFGHAGGAFTGAKMEAKQGLMSIASDGTLFLDEVGELPLNVQAKLLRVIQEKTIRKVGGIQEEKLTCRIVCATHRDLLAMVKERTFRQDLYARISTFELRTLPLKDRTEDVEPILKSLEGGEKLIPLINNKYIDVSMNVRSLQQLVRRYKVLGRLP